jgi:hypothetical protein
MTSSATDLATESANDLINQTPIATSPKQSDPKQSDPKQSDPKQSDNSSDVSSRDRLIEASTDIMLHLTDKAVHLFRKPAIQERIQSLLDPIVNHVIARVFPYIILSSILFLILILVTVSTFIIVVRSSINAIKSVDGSMKTGLPINW